MSMAVASLRLLARGRHRVRLPAPLSAPGCRAAFLSGAAEEVPQADAPPPPPTPGRKVLESFREEFEIGGRVISFETGKMARFANGSVVISMDDTHVLSTVAAAKSSEPVRDFLPLTVDYQEKQYAQGVIPTTYMRREGAPKERELLCGRIIDRPIRPLFPRGFYHEVQIMANVITSDGKQDPDVMAANASSAALMLSDIPWNGPIGVIRVGRVDGKFVLNPTVEELGLSDLNLIYACSRDKTLMIDVQAREITERDLQAGMKLAHTEAIKYINPQIRLAKRAGKEKKEYKISLISDKSYEKIRTLSEAPIEEVFTDSTYGKFERGEALENITQSVRAKLEEECDEDSLKYLNKAVDTVRKQVIRKRIIEKGLRVDGRQLDEVRPLYFTLGAPGDAQRLDSIVGPPTKRFMLHYSFPPFSINEVGKRGGLNRREVGHGTLAEKALLAVLPPEGEFPYTVRVNSEVMASDGSTSMASVCGGSMALMDAGIPVREHVAGVSVGLVSEVDPATGDISSYRILTDILGLEDHLGDMDFKIAGTRAGITAIQLDIKPAGIPLDIICESLEPARKARNQILDRMDLEISSARAMNDGSAPRLATLNFSSDSLRKLLFHRKKIEQETGARVSVNDGTVTIVAKTQPIMDKALEKVEFLVGHEIEIGRTYKGVVSSIKEYGAFVEFNGGQHGLLHISELSHEPVSKVSDVVSVGQVLSLTCIGQDVRGNIKLSLKATLPHPHKKKDLDSKDTDLLPSREVVGWAAIENMPSKDANGVPSISKDEDNMIEEIPGCSTPTVIIRSAAECDAQDVTNGSTKKRPKSAKSSPKPSKPDSERQEVKRATSKKTSGASTAKKNKKEKAEDSASDGLDTIPEQNRSNIQNCSSPSSGSIKLDDVVTAKVYQIRAFGLVLDLGDEVRGMHKFAENGRKTFQNTNCSGMGTDCCYSDTQVPQPASEISDPLVALHQTVGDTVSAIEFDARGEHLAAGDHAGRVILFRRTDNNESHEQQPPPSRAELERTDYAAAAPPVYSYMAEFQSHEQEFDVLHSLEIGEKVKKLRWCARPNNTSLCMLATNDRTVKLWKVSEHRSRKENDGQQPRRRRGTQASLSEIVMHGEDGTGVRTNGYYYEWASKKARGYLSPDSSEHSEKAGEVGEGYTAKCRRVFTRAHRFNINSISNNCDGETFVSADDLRINLWHLEVTGQCFNIVDMKPADMEDLVEVITSAEFHPSSCSLLAYGSSRGFVRLVDLRQSALCDRNVRIFQDRENSIRPRTLFSEIISCISDVKFTGDGKYLLTRDYMNLKLWDLRVENSPMATYKVHEFLRPKLSELYNSDNIFDRFSCCANKDGGYFATGSYSNTFRVFSRGATENPNGTTLEASTNPYSDVLALELKLVVCAPEHLLPVQVKMETDLTAGRTLNVTWHQR
uniref:polyribonucleotide nucleotidyltransferase n=1 Tax=Leersia perrieri TaxID=77586 RepID=A0A0D9VID2_9ORYZ